MSIEHAPRPGDRALRTKSLAKKLDIHERSARELIERGEVRAFKVRGRWFTLESWAEDYLRRMAEQALEDNVA